MREHAKKTLRCASRSSDKLDDYEFLYGCMCMYICDNEITLGFLERNGKKSLSAFPGKSEIKESCRFVRLFLSKKRGPLPALDDIVF